MFTVLLATGIVIVLMGALVQLPVLRRAWRRRRREQRILDACDRTFGPNGYRLERIRRPLADPSWIERLLFPNRMPDRIYTYNIIPTEETSADLSDLNHKLPRPIRKYVDRNINLYRSKEKIK